MSLVTVTWLCPMCDSETDLDVWLPLFGRSRLEDPPVCEECGFEFVAADVLADAKGQQ